MPPIKISNEAERLLFHPQQREILGYWDKSRGANLLPARQDVWFEEVASLVPRLSLTEWRPPNWLGFHMIGGQLVDEGFDDPTGQNLLDFLSPGARDWIIEAISAQFQTPSISLVEHRAFYDDGSMVEYVLIVLPLQENDGSIRFTLSLDLPKIDDHSALKVGANAIGYEYGAACFIDIGFGCPDPLVRDGWPIDTFGAS